MSAAASGNKILGRWWTVARPLGADLGKGRQGWADAPHHGDGDHENVTSGKMFSNLSFTIAHCDYACEAVPTHQRSLAADKNSMVQQRVQGGFQRGAGRGTPREQPTTHSFRCHRRTQAAPGHRLPRRRPLGSPRPRDLPGGDGNGNASAVTPLNVTHFGATRRAAPHALV